MATPSARPPQKPRIVFLTRDPVVHERSGSTTYIFGLLRLLRAQGADVSLVATTAFSRSPRLFFRAISEAPEGVSLRFPGYLRLGSLYLLPLRAKAWARALSRAMARKQSMGPLQRVLDAMYGPALYAGPWDLTLPTPAECEVAIRETDAASATAVVANYCMWGPLLGDGRFGDRRTAILMHDLLSARARRFAEGGTPLDMPLITEAEEMRWLSGADTVLASQPREADGIRQHVTAKVVVTPVVLHPQPLNPEAVVAGRCLFVGSNIAPNRTGLEFLLEAVWPTVRAQVPGATLAIAGTVGAAVGGDARTANLDSLGLEVLGKVPSLESEYARAAVCLVPLLLGTGIKIKLLEALGFGKAIVSTRVGIEGLETWAEEAVSVADSAAEFAAAIVQLLTQEPLRRQREISSLRLAEEYFGADRELDPEFVKALL